MFKEDNTGNIENCLWENTLTFYTLQNLTSIDEAVI